MATGSISDVVDYYEGIQDFDSAVAVALCSTQTTTTATTTTAMTAQSSSSSLLLAETVIERRAVRLLESSDPILAACHHLSVSQIAVGSFGRKRRSPGIDRSSPSGQAAIVKLTRGCEFLTAFMLGRILCPSLVNQSAFFVLRTAERLQMWSA